MSREIEVKFLGRQEYQPCWQAMRDYTDTRTADTADQIWVLEHPPVYTQGQAGKAEHILNPGNIPVVQVDRGGQVTYHGPGQLVIYLLLDIKRLGIGVRALVTLIEEAIIKLLADYDIEAKARADAPGVYAGEAKVASLGLRVRKGCCFHGLALNIDADLAPFYGINPCGYAGMAVTRMADLTEQTLDFDSISQQLAAYLQQALDSLEA